MDETPTTPQPGRRPAWSSNVLDIAGDAFDCLVTGPGPVSLQGRLFDALPDRRLRLDEVRTQLLARDCPPATRDAVWVYLVLRARSDEPAWKVAAVGMALPALRSVTAELTDRFAGDASDIAAEVLRGFLTALADVDVARPRLLNRLRWVAYRAGHAALIDTLHAPTPTGDTLPTTPPTTLAPAAGEPGSTMPSPPYGHPDLVLARAISENVITRLEADLIGATRLEDIPIRFWADDHRTSEWAAYKFRRRAEQRLVTWILHPTDGEPTGTDMGSAVGRGYRRRNPDGDEPQAQVKKSATRMSKTGTKPEVKRCEQKPASRAKGNHRCA